MQDAKEFLNELKSSYDIHGFKSLVYRCYKSLVKNGKVIEDKVDRELYNLRLKDIARDYGGYIKDPQMLGEEHKIHCDLRQSDERYNNWGVDLMQELKIPFKTMPKMWSTFNIKPNLTQIQSLCT